MVDSTARVMTWNLWWRFGPRWRDRQPGIVATLSAVDPAAVTLPSSHPSAPLEAGPEMVDQRIDHVFFRPGREDQQVLVEGARLVGDAVEGVYPSDHRAVVVDLRWRE